MCEVIMSISRSAKEQFDVLVYHFDGDEEEKCVAQLLAIIDGMSIDEKMKTASVAEHFNTGNRFDSIEDALSRLALMIAMF